MDCTQELPRITRKKESLERESTSTILGASFGSPLLVGYTNSRIPGSDIDMFPWVTNKCGIDRVTDYVYSSITSNV